MLGEKDLPSEIANVIRKAWKANGHSGEKMVIKSSPILEQEASELLDETEFDSNMSAESCDVKNDTVSEGGTPPELTECHMLSSDIDQDNKLSSFLDAVENGKKLTDENWLRFLGITEKQLKHILEPIAEHILNLFCYLNSGQVLKNSSSKQIGNVVPYEIVDTFKAGQKPDTLTLLKLLIVMV